MPKEKTARRRRHRRPVYFDYNLLAVVIILICFGLVMLYSASAYEAANDPNLHDGMYYLRRQARNDILALALGIFVSFINYHVWIKYSSSIYVIALILQLAVKVTPLGVTVNGARRWLSLGFTTIQPSEVAKIAVIVFLPYLIMRMGRYMDTVRGVVVLFLAGLFQAGFAYIFTENLSTAVIIAGISFVMIFLAHPKTRPFVIGLILMITAVVLFLLVAGNTMNGSSHFRIRRILAWLHPEDNLSTGGYQVLQGLYAIGSGGFFGKGLGNSTQKLSTIPEAQNDMIFSIICEELGLFGAILVLLLFGFLLYRLFVIAQNSPDLYGTLIASGVFTHVALQVILNIAVVLNLIPTTGVTLPFVSYGGTSVLFLMMEIGIVLNISKNIRYTETDAQIQYDRAVREG